MYFQKYSQKVFPKKNTFLIVRRIGSFRNAGKKGQNVCLFTVLADLIQFHGSYSVNCHLAVASDFVTVSKEVTREHYNM
jgi:hypothetical protein